MSEKPRFVGINHIALEVGDLDQALDFYGRLFDFELRGRIGDKMAFLDAGDQSSPCPPVAARAATTRDTSV